MLNSHVPKPEENDQKLLTQSVLRENATHDQESWRISTLVRCAETEPREAECQLGSSLPSQEKLVSILTYTGGANTLLVVQRPEERLLTWCMEEFFFLNQTEKKMYK